MGWWLVLAQLLPKRKLTDEQFAIILVIPLILALLALNIYPMVYSFWLSLTNTDISRGISKFIGFINYYNLMFKDPYFKHSLRVSLQFTLEASLLAVALSLAFALILNESFKGRRVIRTMAILPWAFSTYAVASLARYLFARSYGLFSSLYVYLGLSDTPIEIVTTESAIHILALLFAWNYVPLGAFFLLAQLQIIPLDLYNQARIDGASAIRRFRVVTLPFLRRPIAIILLLFTVFSVVETTLIIGFTGGGPGRATQALTYWAYAKTFMDYEYGYGAAISWFLILIAMALGVLYYYVLNKLKL